MDSGQDQLYVAYYQPYDYIPPTTRGAEADDGLIDQWYDQAHYEKAISAIIGRPPEKQTTQLKLVLGNCYMQLSKFDDAIPIFKEISTGNTGYKNAADWYLSLCYLAKGNPEVSKPILLGLSSRKSSYAARAQKLLGELE